MTLNGLFTDTSRDWRINDISPGMIIRSVLLSFYVCETPKGLRNASSCGSKFLVHFTAYKIIYLLFHSWMPALPGSCEIFCIAEPWWISTFCLRNQIRDAVLATAAWLLLSSANSYPSLKFCHIVFPATTHPTVKFSTYNRTPSLLITSSANLGYRGKDREALVQGQSVVTLMAGEAGRWVPCCTVSIALSAALSMTSGPRVSPILPDFEVHFFIILKTTFWIYLYICKYPLKMIN